MEKKYLFKNFLKDKHVASIVSSSKFAVNRVCNKLDFGGKKIIVEYGPGTGVFTKILLERMSPESKLILIETNKDMISILKKIKDPRVFIFNDTAENVEDILHQCSEETADYIISGIPFSFIKKDKKHEILGNTRKVLSNNGRFLVYQFTLSVVGYLRRYFTKISYDFVFLNIPPLFIFEAFK
ncbi:MAG TPA: methyltransferase domain-containing protein [Thermodesulfobacteriota bacterium]|jgi:phospholipid N-methyltransferase